MKRFFRFTAVGLVVVVLFSVGMIVGKVTAQEELEKKLEVYLQVLTLVKGQYVEKNLDDTKLVYGSIKGLLEALNDPYTRFMEPQAYKEMRIRLRGSYSGIGIYIGMKDNRLTVIAPIPGTPADKVGLKARDKIVAIDDKSTKDMSLDEAVSIIRGPQGTKVKLSILRGTPRNRPITRSCATGSTSRAPITRSWRTTSPTSNLTHSKNRTRRSSSPKRSTRQKRMTPPA